MVMVYAMIPKPPTHCIKVRQKRSVSGTFERSPSMEKLVPDHPAMQSKSASTNDISRTIMKGMTEMTAKTSHTSATEQSAAERRIPDFLRGSLFNISPTRNKKTVRGSLAGRHSIHR